MGNSKTYDVEEYWNYRATLAYVDLYQAVCAYGRSCIENEAMDAVQRKMFSAMLKGINLKGKRVLELGCGIGRWVPFILNLGALYIGVDISET